MQANTKRIKETKAHALELLTEDHIKSALRNDKGEEAELVSWETKDFLKPGDNYAWEVTSAVVKYRLNDVEKKVSYVVKLNPKQCNKKFEFIIHNLARKEGLYYTVFLPEMNDLLKKFNQPPLRIPKALYADMNKERECLILEDLRPRGFQMFDRKKGLDRVHGMLVMSEFGRMHAASLLKENIIGVDSFIKYGTLQNAWIELGKGSETKEMFTKQMTGYMEGSIKILEKVSGYEDVIAWLKKLQPNLLDHLVTLLEPSDKFGVMIHGDCWTNNILFRYENSGAPVEVMFLDLQQTSKASPAVDLNYFLYSSFNGEERTSNLDDFLTKYYSSFCSTLKAADTDAPFTYEELCQEFANKRLFGCIMAQFLIPIVLSESEDVVDLHNIGTEEVEEFMKERQKTILDMAIREGSYLKPRIISMFDEMKKHGVIS